MSSNTPQPMTESDAKLWAMLAHLSGIVIMVIGPLIIMLVFGPRNDFVKKQATEALNFQIMIAIGLLISLALMVVGIGFILFPIVWIVGLVFFIIGGLKAYQGEDYRYPFSIRMVK
jgi:uncharacterized Tic20 family protein